jgi:hypothetical protein
VVVDLRDCHLAILVTNLHELGGIIHLNIPGIWVCLKMGYTPNYSHLVGIMIINHWVIGYTIFRQSHIFVFVVFFLAKSMFFGGFTMFYPNVSWDIVHLFMRKIN